MLTKELERLATEKEVVGDKTRYHFKRGIIVNSPKVKGIFYDIVKEEDQIVLFDGISPFARIIKEENYPKTTLKL